MNKTVRVLNADNCSGCQLCQMVCSFFNDEEKKFNPSRAHIKISRHNGENRFRVDLLPGCTHCGLCVHYCYYDVLSGEKGDG